ncbi:hypothetical protein EZJ43_02180 [Pedobacter changchengzhani]|uniref:Uracil-DNA glycosylase-like domain-containing protein n=1 Tax=Pedobacter changchengzhani TaxID=2529274 RepID=A0A4R5MPX6_9SPHI|nr:hypothetical protein [Pedobacter changchengzhani]TDG37920.1 hypothetical protein EZJ43_02180 [Pedobacter changchengzhani]
MNTEELDKSLKELEELTWMPWVGSEYLNATTENRVLFIGESHYFNDLEDKISYEDKNITRAIVNDMALKGNRHKSPFFDNIHRMIFGAADLTEEQKMKFWNNISFYNFIQKPMDSKNGRPRQGDFELGWKNFYELIEVLKPTTCIFLGILAGNHYGAGVKYCNDYTLEVKGWKEFSFGRGKSIHIELSQKDKEETNLYFVQHPSNYFSPTKCNEFLTLKDPKTMQWLKDLI